MPYDEELTKEILRRADIVDVVSKYRTVIKKGKVRRAKLNFLKGIKGTFKIKERN